MTTHQHAALAALRDQLVVAPHGSKREPVERCAEQLGVSVPTVHRWLRAAAYDASPRKRRADAGGTKVERDTLVQLSAMLHETKRQNGRRIMTTSGALETLDANKLLPRLVSASRASVLLRTHGLHPTQICRPTPSVAQRSEHPNHVWQVDASICTPYYLSNATGLTLLDEKVFYKNKPGNLTRIQQERLIRYTVTDHYSHSILTRYYLGSESAKNLTDFLTWAFEQKGRNHLMHGVPRIVMMDKGSANTSHITLNLLKQLGVRVIVHERHNSRANGSVEKAHHLVEVNFESSLKFARVDGLDDLNAKALDWAHHYCATRKHTRHAMTRYASWMTITAEQLRLAPSAELMRELVHSLPEHRRVSNNLTVTFALKSLGSFTYPVHLVPGVRAGDKIRVAINAFRTPAVDVEYVDETGECHWMVVAPLVKNEMGFLANAPVIGEELRQAPCGIVDRNRDEVMLQAYGSSTAQGETRTEQIAAAAMAKEKGALVFGGNVNPFMAVNDAQLPAFMPKRGTVLEAPATRTVEAARHSTFAACKLVLDGLRRLGAEHVYQADLVYPWIAARFGEHGMPDDQVEVVCHQLMANAELQAPVRNPVRSDGEVPALRAVGGGA